jgi:cis-3-alkyl-4-acyloxetan-2-one decarboxylase
MADWRALYPFSSHHFALPSHGSPQMHYVDEGVGPQCVLCVHGNPTWSFYYRQVVLEQRKQARVVAVDHIGCGLSDKPQDYPYTLAQHIANLVDLVKHLDLQRITLVVHDWGGAIGLGTALRIPERVTGLVILNTAAFPPPYVPLRIAACRVPVIGNWAMRRLNVFARAAQTMTLNRLPRLPDDVAAGLIAPYDSWEHRVAIARFVQDIPTRPSQATWQLLKSIEAGLPSLSDRPAELVWGMRDWCFRPECLTRFEQLLPQARASRLEDVGHYVMEEASQEVNAALTRCMGAQRT